ncbi:MAG TPA: hypothetical protein VK982_06380 [Bacteroidales bacterium]|nr:hypothetical protein [Bacteroidales bacterium]
MIKKLRNLKNCIAYHKIVKVAKSCYYDAFQNRYIVDLSKGYLFYYPAEGKITTSLKGLVFKNKKQCHFTRKELNELLEDIENA